MKNNIYENFSKEKFNQDNNFKIIMSKIEKEEKINHFKKSNILAFLLVIILVSIITPSIYAKIKFEIQFKEYQNREFKYAHTSIKDATENGYIENIIMDYVTQEDISVKIDSLLIANDYLEIKTNFKFPENVKIDSEQFSYGYAIYDENKNIYGIVPRNHVESSTSFTNYTKLMYKEIGVKYNPFNLFDVQLNEGSAIENLSAENYNIISKITMNGSQNFPKSKNLFVRIFDLGFYMYDENTLYNSDFKVSDSEWIFKLDIPEKFYNSDNITLRTKDELPGIECNEIIVDNVRMKVNLNIDGYADYVSGKDADTLYKMITLFDESGNIYYHMHGNSHDNNVTEYFEINKNMLDKKLFLNIQLGDKTYTSELIY